MAPTAIHPRDFDLLRGIYDAALDASLWPVFLAHFAQAFDSEAAVIFGHDFSDGSSLVDLAAQSLAAFHGMEDSAIANFAAHYCRVNVWTENEHLHHEGLVVNAARLYPLGSLSRTEWYAGWLRPQSLFHSFAAIVEKRAQRSLNLSALRTERRGTYSRQEEDRLRALMPHLQTAFALHRKLHHTQALAQASFAVLESLPIGVILFSRDGKVMHASDKARSLMGLGKLLRLGASKTLRASAHQDDLWLQEAIRRTTGTGSGQSSHAGMARRLSGLCGAELHVLAAPLPEWSSPYGAHAAGALFISDPGRMPGGIQAVLRSLYCLTVSEAMLAEALVAGLTPQEYAQRHGLSIHTVRSQFKSIAAKAGVSRQSDFVRTVLTGPILMRLQRQDPDSAPGSHA